MRKSEVNYYKVLGVTPGATSSEIKQHYRALSKVHHPDANGGDGTRMALINEAYTVLSDPLKRMDYTPPAPPQPKTAPIRTAHTYQTHATSPWPKTTHTPKAKPVPEEASWSFLLWYILAVPLAIFVVTFGPSAYKSIQAKADALMAEKQAIPSETSTAPATSTETSPSMGNQAADSDPNTPSNAVNSTEAPSSTSTTEPDTSDTNNVPNTQQGLQYYLYGNRHYKKSN